MNVILINQFFWPDNAPTAQLLTELANELAGQGCSVRVFCGSSKYENCNVQAYSSLAPGIRVVRCPTWPFGRKVVARLLSYLTFLGGSLILGVFGKRPDLVITMTTPPLLGITGTLLKFLTRAKHFDWEMDLYPEVGIDLGVFDPRSTIIRLLTKLSGLIRRRADGILTLGPCMRRRLIEQGIDPGKIFITENWANGDLIFPVQKRKSANRFIVHYSGNLGLAHDADTIRAAIGDLRGDPRFEFVFVGGGKKHLDLKARREAGELPQASFFPYCEPSELAANFGRGDIGLVTQHPGCVGSVVPSKMYAYMAAGTPFLYIGPAGATAVETIAQFGCGWHVPCGDPVGVRRLLEDLAANPERVREAGHNARQAFLEHYDLPVGTGRILNALDIHRTGAVAASVRCRVVAAGE